MFTKCAARRLNKIPWYFRFKQKTMSDEIPIFSHLTIEGWRQIDCVDIEFHPRLTIITGANGAGKTTLLSFLIRQFGWHKQYLGTPIQSKTGTTNFFSGVFKSISKLIGIDTQDTSSVGKIGKIGYSNGSQSTLIVPEQTSKTYDVSVTNPIHIVGFHVDSHRPSFAYQEVTMIPTNPITANHAYTQYNAEMISRFMNGDGNHRPIFRIKESLISMATFGEGNKTLQGNKEILATYTGFVEALKKTLPESIGFVDLSIRMPDIVMVTETGEFMLDASSGGLMALIDLTFRLHMFSIGKPSFVVTMDEPENHLHPTMQRSLMRKLLSAFPQAQFIVATHSPFIVSSVRESNVYALRYIEVDLAQTNTADIISKRKKVVSEKLDTINRAGNAGEILREVLGVASTMPEWVELDIENLVNKYRGKEIDTETLRSLREDLKAIGQSEFYSEALASLVK